MASSRHERLLALDRAHVWHPFTQMAVWPSDDPLIIERAEGNELIDDLGRRYLDGVSSLWCNVHGHRKGELDDAVRAQLDRVAHSTLLGLGRRSTSKSRPRKMPWKSSMPPTETEPTVSPW